MQLTINLSQTAYEQLLRQAQTQDRLPAEVAAQVLEEAETQRRAAFFERLRAAGRILPQAPSTDEARPPFKRIDVQGKPVSECLIEERR